ncbi:RHS repeat-associated core domain-containing protein [Myxococcus sp. K38C18041901]|uniref:RHS repeat-associated core domain-containing protein n=1 Tax=Myxococcus guangdongensis TaxID=2906760 RepID=UPI0020A719EF|nr:RHS repeat-associated core domain-containing protein [Myxococcus guangdongensis]MCP3059576.1 RHS repeat-associated core domain-containing protein [Myxococcus guangdongensis]
MLGAVSSTIALTDALGTLATEYTYEPYGEAAYTGTAGTSAQTFAGREDDGTGLYYFRARYYNPKPGRFLQPEPLSQDPEAIQVYALLGQGLPLYAYASNNPLTYNDPMEENPVAVAIAGAAVGGPIGAAVGAAVGYCATHPGACPWIPMPWDPPADDISQNPPVPPGACPMGKGERGFSGNSHQTNNPLKQTHPTPD